MNARHRISGWLRAGAVALMIPGMAAPGCRMSVPQTLRQAHQNTASVQAADERDERDHDGATHGLEAIEFRRMMRLDDTGDLSPRALVRAKEQAEQIPELRVEGGVTRDAGIWQWEWLGPGNIGGRIRTILFTNNSTIWIGGVAGGIWKSESLGNSWLPVNDFLPNLAITSLVRDPSNTLFMYAATGENFGAPDGLPGVGVFRSGDGGQTWQQLPATLNWTYTNRLAHHPTQQFLLYAATHSGVFRTTDGGDTWTPVLAVPFALDVKVDPSNPARVLVGTHFGVYLSTQNGLAGTFVEQTTGAAGKLPFNTDRCEAAFGAGGAMWVSMNRNDGEVWRSTDGGVTWSLRNGSTGYLCNGANCQGDYDNAIWASPDDPNLVVVGGIDLYRSTDGGLNFSRISAWQKYHIGESAHADQHYIQHPPDYGPNNRALYFANDGGIQRTLDIYTVSVGNGWQNLANNLGITQFYAGAAAPDGSVIVGGTQDNDKLRYSPADGVQAWYQAETGDGGFAAVDYNDHDVIYGEYVQLRVKKSTNGGDSYSDHINGLSDADTCAAFIAPFSMSSADPGVLAAGGCSLWRTTNGADDWDHIRAPIAGMPVCTAIDIANGSTTNIWAGYSSGRVSRSNDPDVLTWTDIDDSGPAPLPNRAVTDIAISPSNPAEVIVTFGGYAPDNVWMTVDNGASWQRRTGSGATALPAVHVTTVRYHPLDTQWVYVGTDLGLFASEDKGLTWNRTPRHEGAPWDHDGPVNTEVAELFWQGDQYLIAATHGRGMFRTRPLVVVYVDVANQGSEDGTAQYPYNTVREGFEAAGNGSAISVTSGDYAEGSQILTGKRVRVVANGGLVRLH